jgi:hypothetical protein
MVLTRAERKQARKAALAHVLTEALELDDNSPLHRALSKEDHDIYTVINLSFEDIDKLTYIDDQGSERPLEQPVLYSLSPSLQILLHSPQKSRKPSWGQLDRYYPQRHNRLLRWSRLSSCLDFSIIPGLGSITATVIDESTCLRSNR